MTPKADSILIMVLLFSLVLPASCAEPGSSNIDGDADGDIDPDQTENESAIVSDGVDWGEFLSRSDMVWERGSDRWQDGAFTGNGMLGTMTYRKDGRTLRFRLGRSDITAHYRIPLVDWSEPRIPIGDFLLSTTGTVQSETMRLNLFDAEVSGLITTEKGSVKWRVFTHAEEMVVVLDVGVTGDEKVTLSMEPIHGISPRIVAEGVEVAPDQVPPLPTCAQDADGGTCAQHFLPGGDYATAWKVNADADRHTVFLTIANGWPDGGAENAAAEKVQDFSRAGLAALEASHRGWWHEWWPRDFLSIPDANWESFYWIQMYKHASATRPGRMLIDNQGPWLTETGWPGVWWNLNVQLSYSPVYATDRLDQGLSLIEALNTNIDNLKFNASEYGEDVAHIDRYSTYDLISWVLGSDAVVVYELGNLTWVLHDYWRHYRATMDDDLLRDGLFPLLRLSINLYLKMLEEGEEGRLHLPPTHSPEYGESSLPALFADCTYALSLLRWGCGVLLWTNERLQINDPSAPQWQDVLDRLVDLPTNENGLMIGADQPFEHGHRHFSHLISIFPLYEFSGRTAQEINFIDVSANHWIAMGERDGGFEGYSWVAASSIASLLGRGDEALGFLDRTAERFEPATMYVEAGPVIETPLAAARALQDMLIQSHGGVIRVFPAVPSQWRDAAFHHLRAEGAFRVSAARATGQTRWILVESQAGEPCRLSCDLPDPVSVIGAWQGTASREADGSLTLELGKGESVLLYHGEEPPTAVITPVAPEGDTNHYGLKTAR